MVGAAVTGSVVTDGTALLGGSCLAGECQAGRAELNADHVVGPPAGNPNEVSEAMGDEARNGVG